MVGTLPFDSDVKKLVKFIRKSRPKNLTLTWLIKGKPTKKKPNIYNNIANIVNSK
jgi:hypothetical protein